MAGLKGRVAWVTGAGSGIGEAAALALAAEGATLVLSGRRTEPLEAVRSRIEGAGGTARVMPGDMSRADTAAIIAGKIEAEFGRIDVLVSNAGSNIRDRSWARLTPQGVDEVLQANLSSCFYGALAVLPIMRRQQDGVIINTASNAGRFVMSFPGPSYTAAKHGVVALTHGINIEEGVNGIRATAICPGETATPILDRRPVPVSAEARARMLQSEDVGGLICYIATLPPRVCINEVVVQPTWNRHYIASVENGF